MRTFLGFLDFICLLLITVSIIYFIVQLVRKKSKKIPIFVFCASLVLMLTFTFVAVTFFPVDSDETEENLSLKDTDGNENKSMSTVGENNQKVDKNDKHANKKNKEEGGLDDDTKKQKTENVKQSTLEETEKQVSTEDKNIEATPSVEEIEAPSNEESEVVDVSSLSEAEYKEICETLWYDDVFFSKDDLEGKHVKLDLFVEEWRFFDENAAYNVLASDFINKFNLQREFYKCGVQRENENSYVGGQITMYFSNDYGYSASNMTEGDHLIVYGEIIDYSTSTMDGYNSCSITPKYIEW